MVAEAIEDVSLAKLRQVYGGGQCTVAEVLAGVMARIAAYDRKGVWVSVATLPQIEQQVARVEAARHAGKTMPLFGVPFAVKDIIDVAGMPTTAACPAYAYTPVHSAPVVQKLCDAGAICVGKTNLDQFATGLVGTRSPYGACENAFNRAWISGGSSSGSAVAVAGGLVTFSLGTDTAGSGRVPAAFNDIVGLKPTRGLLSAAGVVPACRSLDCVSIFAGNCADAAAAMHVAGGCDSADAYSRPAPAPSPAHSIKGLRIGVPAGEMEFFGNKEMERLFAIAIERIKELGGKVLSFDFDPFRRAGDLLYGGPWVAERLVAAGRLLRENPAALRPELRTILTDAQRYTAGDVFDAQFQLAALRRAADEVWNAADVLLLPTAGTIYRIADIEADPLRLNRNLGHYTTFVNLLDLSALAVPCGFLPTGLPMGVSFIAPAFQEATLLAVGEPFHAALLQERKNA